MGKVYKTTSISLEKSVIHKSFYALQGKSCCQFIRENKYHLDLFKQIRTLYCLNANIVCYKSN